MKFGSMPLTITRLLPLSTTLSNSPITQSPYDIMRLKSLLWTENLDHINIMMQIKLFLFVFIYLSVLFCLFKALRNIVLITAPNFSI